MPIDYSHPLIRGYSDFFRLPVVLSPTEEIFLIEEADPDSALYLIDDCDSGGFTREIYPAVIPDPDEHPAAIWLGALTEDASEREPNPEYGEISQGNTKTIRARTLTGASPVRRAKLLYGGSAAIENMFALPGGSNADPSYLFEGLQSNTPNLLEPEYALLEIAYNLFDPKFIRLWLYFCGNFEAAKFTHNPEVQTFEMVYKALPGKDVDGVPFQENFAFSRRWSATRSDLGTVVAYR